MTREAELDVLIAQATALMREIGMMGLGDIRREPDRLGRLQGQLLLAAIRLEAFHRR
jgi:hypothetical protein